MMQMRLFVVVGLLLGSVGLSPLNGQDFVKSARVRAIVDKAIEFLKATLQVLKCRRRLMVQSLSGIRCMSRYLSGARRKESPQGGGW